MRGADTGLALDGEARGPATGATPASRRHAPDRPRALRLLRRLRDTRQGRTALVGKAGLRPGPRPPLGPRAARATPGHLRDVPGRDTLVVGERLSVSGHRHRLPGRTRTELPSRRALRCRGGERRLPAPIPRKRPPRVVAAATPPLQRSLSGGCGAGGGPRSVPAVLEFDGPGRHRPRDRAQDAGRRVGLVLSDLWSHAPAADRASENAAVVRVVPHQPACYGVKVVMERCRMNPCRFGAALPTLPPR